MLRGDFETQAFPFLFGGTFIEGENKGTAGNLTTQISLPFRRDFH